jgi:predicted nucleotidyltransferase
VDLFADYPMNFDALLADSQLMALAGTTVRVASIAHLIAIKRAAGRRRDLEDVERLTALIERRP